MGIKLGDTVATTTTNTNELLYLILWGVSGCGKTTLASTAPKPILFIQFDHGGTASLKRDDGIHVLDLSSQKVAVTALFKSEKNPDLVAFEKSIIDSGISTIVLDSATTFGEKAFLYSLDVGQQYAKKNERVVLESPGWTGYGIKYAYVKSAITNIFNIAVRCKCNFILICHEGVPDKNEQGSIVQQTIELGSSLAKTVPISFREVWYMNEQQSQKMIYLRPIGVTTPMKTSMFSATKFTRFAWNYNPETGEGDGISKWYDLWKANGFNKIELPK